MSRSQRNLNPEWESQCTPTEVQTSCTCQVAQFTSFIYQRAGVCDDGMHANSSALTSIFLRFRRSVSLRLESGLKCATGLFVRTDCITSLIVISPGLLVFSSSRLLASVSLARTVRPRSPPHSFTPALRHSLAGKILVNIAHTHATGHNSNQVR